MSVGNASGKFDVGASPTPSDQTDPPGINQLLLVQVTNHGTELGAFSH